MKKRSSFVANSSSSSFICEICGEGDVYSDGISLSDIDMCRCVNGHLMCNEHKLDDEEENEDGEEPESSCPICQFKEYSENEMAMYLLKKYNISRESVFEMIKAINKRRKKLYDKEYIKEVCQQMNVSDEDMLNEIREKFTSFEEYSEYIRNY